MMMASKFHRLNLYHIKILPLLATGYVSQKVCSYSSMIVVQSRYRQWEYSGAIRGWQVYQLDPAIAKDTRIDDTWHFMDERGDIHASEILYIRLLAGI